MSLETDFSPNIFPKARQPSKRAAGLGIHRTGHVALRAPNPEAAAEFAVNQMGFTLAGHDDEGRYYLSAAGPDPYSLVYTPGQGGLEHISYIVADHAALDEAAARLANANIPVTRREPSAWNPGASLRFSTPAGHTLQLTTGLIADTPIAATTPRPAIAGSPIVCDHVVVRCTDVPAESAFAAGTLGLMESSRIEAPDATPVMTFFRASKLYHCIALAQSGSNGLHHVQFTLKDGAAVFEAWEKMRSEARVELLWGPVRHGPGHNIACYFRDQAGHVIEYSAEEEVIFDDEAYSPMRWSVEDQRSLDEWGTRPPENML